RPARRGLRGAGGFGTTGGRGGGTVVLSLVGDAGVAADFLRAQRGPEEKANERDDDDEGEEATGFHVGSLVRGVKIGNGQTGIHLAPPHRPWESSTDSPPHPWESAIGNGESGRKTSPHRTLPPFFTAAPPRFPIPTIPHSRLPIPKGGAAGCGSFPIPDCPFPREGWWRNASRCTPPRRKLGFMITGG